MNTTSKGRYTAPRWVIKLFELLIIPALFAFVGLYWSSFAVGPRVTVYYTFDEGYFTLPSKSRHFLLLLSAIRDLVWQKQLTMNIQEADLSQMRENVEKIPPIVRGMPNIQLFDDSVNLITDISDFAPRIYYDQVVRLTIVNSGNRTASDITISPYIQGTFEIFRGGLGEPESQGHTLPMTQISIPSLQPEERIYVIFWPDDYLDERYPPVSARHADGIARVEPYAIGRDGSSLIFLVPRSILIIMGSMAAAFVAIFIFRRIFSRGTEEDHEEESSTKQSSL